MEYRMSKLTFNELTDKWQNVTIHCQEGIRKFSNIKIPYRSNTAITLEVAKQLLVDMSIEEFINIIKKPTIFGDKSYHNTIYEGSDHDRKYLYEHISSIESWILDFPIQNQVESIKHAILEFYIKNTCIYTDDFLTWVKNASPEIIKNFESLSEQSNSEISDSCWYTDKITKHDPFNRAFEQGEYLPAKVKKFINEGDEVFGYFLQSIISYRDESNSMHELCKKIQESYTNLYGNNIQQALLGFLIRCKSQGKLTSGNCYAYGKRYMR